MINIIWEKENKKYQNNVVYKITIGDKTYIGETKRPLDTRIKEHIRDKRSEVNKYIQENNIQEIQVKILQEIDNERKLYGKETQSIARYIISNSKKKSKENLLNKDYKGLDKMTMKQMKDLVKSY